MALTDDIRNCRTPAEALLMLAQRVQELTERIEQLDLQAADPWAEPLQWDNHEVHLQAAKEFKAVVDRDAIAECEAKLAAATDGNDIEALTARLRLLKDAAGQNVYDPNAGAASKMGERPDQGKRVEIKSMGGEGTVTVFEVDRERMDARVAWAEKVKLWQHIPLEANAAVEAYSKGGPMWLYLGNRDAVIAMPYEWRRELVEEIALDSTAEAQEVGRDLLMIRSESTDQSITTAAIEATSAARGLR